MDSTKSRKSVRPSNVLEKMNSKKSRKVGKCPPLRESRDTHMTTLVPLGDPSRYIALKTYLKSIHADETLCFHEAISKRVPPRTIVKEFILDDAPQQVLLKCETRAPILVAYSTRKKLHHTIFTDAHIETLRDLRRSEAFKSFFAT